MSKMIIDNQSSISDAAAILAVSEVIKYGRISANGKQYCHAVVMGTDEGKILVCSDLNKCSDRFIIVDEN